MASVHRWFAAGAVLAVGLVSVGANNVFRPEQFVYGPTTEPTSQPATTQPTTLPTELKLYAGEKPDEWESYQALHAYILDRFVRTEGFGLGRMGPVEDEARSKRVYADGTRYIVGRVQLISLNSGKKPFAYATRSGDVKMKALKRARRVALDQFELSALDELKMGKEVVLTGFGGDREFVGAVRATGQCVNCHHAPEGTLIGAFRYPLVEEASVPQQEISRSERRAR